MQTVSALSIDTLYQRLQPTTCSFACEIGIPLSFPECTLRQAISRGQLRVLTKNHALVVCRYLCKVIHIGTTSVSESGAADAAQRAALSKRQRPGTSTRSTCLRQYENLKAKHEHDHLGPSS